MATVVVMVVVLAVCGGDGGWLFAAVVIHSGR